MANNEKLGEKERVIVSPSLVKFDASTYVYNPHFDLGIGKEMATKAPCDGESSH